MSTRLSPFAAWGLSLGLCVFNLLIAVCTLKIDFFPSSLAWLCGIAFGVACAGYQLFAGLFARARMEQIPEPRRERIRGSLAMKSVLVLAFSQLLLGTIAFSRGISGLYVWATGENVARTYEVTRVHWNSSRYKRCYQHELEGLDSYTNITFAPCLDVDLHAGTKLVFRGRESSLGFKTYNFSVAL